MVNALDLTQRQSASLLEQAVRTQARLEIEPRNLPDGEILTASIVGRQGTSLVVTLQRNPSQVPPLAMIGAWLGGMVLDRMSDVNFLKYTRWIVTALGAIYLVQAAVSFAAG